LVRRRTPLLEGARVSSTEPLGVTSFLVIGSSELASSVVGDLAGRLLVELRVPSHRLHLLQDHARGYLRRGSLLLGFFRDLGQCLLLLGTLVNLGVLQQRSEALSILR